jgi:hypothetical protein
MTKQNLDQFKKILERYNHALPPEDVFEIRKNVKQLADVIIEFERKKVENKNQ